MAVVVKKTKGSRYKVHRVLNPDGKPFILPDMANAEPRTGRHVTGGAKAPGVIERPINSASILFVAESEADANKRFSRRTAEGAAVGEAIDAQNAELREDVKLLRELKTLLTREENGTKVCQSLTDSAAKWLMGEAASISGSYSDYREALKKQHDKAAEANRKERERATERRRITAEKAKIRRVLLAIKNLQNNRKREGKKTARRKCHRGESSQHFKRSSFFT